MTLRTDILLLIASMGVVTFLPRVVPISLLQRFTLPEVFERWLAFLPIAVIAALLTIEVLVVDGQIVRNIAEAPMVPVGVVALVALWRRSLIASVAAGVVTAALIEFI